MGNERRTQANGQDPRKAAGELEAADRFELKFCAAEAARLQAVAGNLALQHAEVIRQFRDAELQREQAVRRIRERYGLTDRDRIDGEGRITRIAVEPPPPSEQATENPHPSEQATRA